MDQLAASALAIEVACALPGRQRLIGLTVPPGTTARDAVRLSGIARQFPALDIGCCQLGVWGQLVADDAVVGDGARIEIYRPLNNDPRETRMRLAAQGQTMGPGSD